MRPPANANDFVLWKQLHWAERHGIRLGSQFRFAADAAERERGQRSRVFDLKDNLFDAPSAELIDQLVNGSGDELIAGSDPLDGNLFAINSSSALCCNVFSYWRTSGNLAHLTDLLDLGSAAAIALQFEAQLPIVQRGTPPNLDVLLRYLLEGDNRGLGVESKFGEPYSPRGHSGLNAAYLAKRNEHLWRELPTLYSLAQEISPHDGRFWHLHAAQLLCHILGLSAAFGVRKFALLYLWYEVPYDESARHGEEIEEFTRIAEKDGVAFRSLTHQRLFAMICAAAGSEHREYQSYMRDRYFD